MHQRSLCDSHHTSHDATREHIAERGEMEHAPHTSSTYQVQDLYWEQDSDDSLSSDDDVAYGEHGTIHSMPEELEEQSECSENSTNTWNEIYGSSVHSDQQLETVYMVCIWEVHHYQVDRDLDDGEPHPEYEDDYGDYHSREGSTSPMLFKDRNGQLWSYEDDIIPCDDAQECGQNCESPVERHWVESEVPDWIQDSDGNSPESEGEDDSEDDFEEESEAEKDPFVDELELKVENCY